MMLSLVSFIVHCSNTLIMLFLKRSIHSEKCFRPVFNPSLDVWSLPDHFDKAIQRRWCYCSWVQGPHGIHCHVIKKTNKYYVCIGYPVSNQILSAIVIQQFDHKADKLRHCLFLKVSFVDLFLFFILLVASFDSLVCKVSAEADEH